MRLLGPVDVLADDGPRPVPGLRRKAILATLALHGGEVVGSGRLVDLVWGDAASAKSVSTLQSNVSFLRGVLGSRDAILGRPPGYLLDLGADGTDVRVAERLLHAGRQAADPVGGVRDLRAALALWRGPALADVAGVTWLEQQADRLDSLLLQVKRALVEARLAAGEHAQLVPELERMVAEHPLDELIHAQLMLALYRSGRQTDALARYQWLWRTLAEEMGLAPGQAIRDLEAAILRQDPDLDPPAPAVMAPPASVPVPAQLPPAVAGFTGRLAELAALSAISPGPGEESSAQPATVVISAVSGTAGVGKTALAVHWAHRAAARFPDGQLYVNLRGFDPGGLPLSPAEAVRGFLDAFGVAPERIPHELAAQTALYRSLLAGKRVLVVLDNAKDADQVRPLLPGSPGCLAVVTSRNQLAGLVALEGARPLSLDLLSTAEAHDLLARRLGDDRVGAEPDAVAEIIERCARLPLALTIAAARAAISPGFPLAAVAGELRRAIGVLDPFDGGDLVSDARAVFSWSYRGLSPDAARLFRLLGLQAGPDIAVLAAASLAEIPPGRARVLLAELTDAHLLSEHRPGRYAFHDLLRAYATEQAQAHDSQSVQDAAVRRILDHYLHTAHRAATLMQPNYVPVTLARPQPGAVVGELATDEDALAWFRAEQATLLAALPLASDAGLGTHTWQLAWALSGFLQRRGLWLTQAAVCRTGLDAARRDSDTAGQAYSLDRLAVGHARSGHNDDAGPLLRQALRLFETAGDLVGQAYIHGSLAALAGSQQCLADALSHSLRSLELFRAADHRAGQVIALNNVGYSYAELGDYQLALSYCEQALAMVKELGADSSEEFAPWDSLGYIHHRLGDYQRAIRCYERAVAISRERADRYYEAMTLDRLGDVHHSRGDAAAARRAWSQALRIFDEIDHPAGGPVRDKL